MATQVDASGSGAHRYRGGDAGAVAGTGGFRTAWAAAARAAISVSLALRSIEPADVVPAPE